MRDNISFNPDLHRGYGGDPDYTGIQLINLRRQGFIFLLQLFNFCVQSLNLSLNTALSLSPILGAKPVP